MSSQTKELTLKQISEDRSLAAAMLFPHRHKQRTPEFHIQIMDMWRSADEFVSIEAFRQGAKTTLSEEFLLIEALFGNFVYCTIFGETYTKACQRITSMKNELLTNMKIYTLFGKQKGDKWSENKIVLPNGVCIEAHGWEEEIRGFDHNGNRPDRAYLDDIENKTMVRDTATVDMHWNKLHLELIPAMDKESRKVRMTGTPLADDCLIRRAAASPNWVSGQFPICDRDPSDPEAKSLWPERYPIEWIRNEREMYESNGLLRGFNQEFMLIASGSAGKPFTEDMIHFEDVGPRMYAPKVVIIDPARTVDVKKSDQSGHVVVSRIGTKIYVWESAGEFLQPDAIVGLAFDASKAYDDCDVAIEKNSLDDWLLQPIRARMLDSGQMINLKTLNAPQDRDKTQFIMGLQPFFKAGDIILVGGRHKHKQLISQILNFPSGKKDVLNALAYAPRVFSGTPVYHDFSEKNLCEGYVPKRSDSLILGANSTGSETTAVLCAFDGSYLTVLADWISPLLPNDCVPDIAKLIRAIYPGKPVAAWVPADNFDQVGRNPLVAALKLVGMRPARSEHTYMLRSSLSPMIRTEMRGRRLLQVDANARHTMQAMACGYHWSVRVGGERAADPERGPARTLIESLECLTYGMNKQDNAPQLHTNAHNASGTAYMSALSRK